MISVIISSADPGLLQKVSENIGETVGVAHEIIAIENGGRAMGICEVYNKGARQAKYDLLCFMHEDIRIITHEWGKAVVNFFSESDRLGLVGVAGSSYKALTPSGWDCGGIDLEPTVYRNIIQFFKHSHKSAVHDHSNPGGKPLEKVASIDGVWFCTRKSIVLEFPFDENLLKGFHGYDVDFSLSVGTKYDIAVTFDVLMEHFSEGRFGKEWFEAILKVHKKWAFRLPVNVAGLDEGQAWVREKLAFRLVLQDMLQAGYSSFSLYKLIWASRVSRMMKKKMLWLKLAFFVFRFTAFDSRKNS